MWVQKLVTPKKLHLWRLTKTNFHLFVAQNGFCEVISGISDTFFTIINNRLQSHMEMITESRFTTENYFHKTLIKANVWVVIIYYPSLMQTINTSGPYPVYDSHDDFISHGKQTTRLPINGEIWPLLVGHTNDDIENCCPIREWLTMKQTENGKNHTCKR